MEPTYTEWFVSSGYDETVRLKSTTDDEALQAACEMCEKAQGA